MRLHIMGIAPIVTAWAEAGYQSCAEEAAVAAYRAFTSFLLGHLLLEVAAAGADVGPLDVLDDGEAEDPQLTDYPLVRRLRSALSEDHSAAEFEESLENLLDRLTLLRAEKQPPPT